jgi:hypothetical protein
MGLVSRAGSYEHVQSTASDTWAITHNLNTDTPVVDCWVLDGGLNTKIIPESVVATSVNVVTITFSAEYTGRALVV